MSILYNRKPEVLWNMPQGLNSSEQAQARNNIGASALASLAASFESRAPSYNWRAGEVCTYGGKLWQFDSNHSGDWTGADVHEVSVADILPVVNSLNLNDYTYQNLIDDIVYYNGFDRRNSEDEYVRFYPSLSLLTFNLILKSSSSIVSPSWTNLFTLTNNQFWFSDYGLDNSKIPVGVLGIGGGVTFTSGVGVDGKTNNNIVLHGLISSGHCSYKDVLNQSTNYGCYFNKAFTVVKK